MQVHPCRDPANRPQHLQYGKHCVLMGPHIYSQLAHESTLMGDKGYSMMYN